MSPTGLIRWSGLGPMVAGALFVLFALLGVGLAWFGYALRSSASERQAVRVAARRVPVAG